MIDKLIEKILALKNPSCAGLDTDLSYLPEAEIAKVKTHYEAAKAITEFNFNIIDKIKAVVPAVKVQAAYYEQYGVEGMRAFRNTLAYAKNSGLITIADVKRNDIGSTAECYSKAYLPAGAPFESDFITVNGYLGADGVEPFIADCGKYGKGIFILVKTSNPSSGQLQDKPFRDGVTLYETMGRLVSEWGKTTIGKYGYSRVGAVVGATHSAQAARLRSLMPGAFFLVPGYGAQGGTAEDLKVCFGANGVGAIVNSSRGIICAYKSGKYKSSDYARAAYNACADMREDLNKVIKIY